MRGAQSSAAVKSDFFRGLGVSEFEFREVGFDFFGGRPTHHVEAHHLVSPLRWLASGPKGDHQAGNDRTVSLDRNAVLVVTQQVTAAQQMLELPEEDFNRPTVSVQERDDLGGNVEQVCRNSQEAIAIDTR